ncbi:MAG: DNA primase [Bacteroidaceae bacterium]|nr:DNA primase [Bacteroidaceae bacterium]
MIPQSTIDRILDRADIVSVIGEYVELKKRGTNYVACCPFHSEKTPSFVVSPARQTWHCFGGCSEGGNVIGFLMKREALTFPEAVRKLAARYAIPIDDEPESNDQREKRLKREALLLLNQRVADFYAHCLHETRGANALHYAQSRFSADYCAEIGLGYAPTGNALLAWAFERGENIDQLIELGLIRIKEKTNASDDTQMYDFFRDRLVIPIRDRRRNVIGFTCRDLTGRDGTAKYLNSTESLVYHKGRSVFGIDLAWREAMKTEQFFLVEGAPDAMKMQSVGLHTAVAPLGSAWTEDQLQMLKRAAPSVCFINDADPVPDGKDYGGGIAFVLKNGELALRLGLNVSVRELPCKEGNLKQDPGDFFSSASKLRQLKEEDFILWAAQKLVRKDDGNFKKYDALMKIAELASYIADDTRLEMYIEDLVKFRKGASWWRSVIYNKRRERKQATLNKGEIDLRQYGFVEERGAYCGLSDRGEQTWSNFTMQPLFHILDEDAPRRLFSVKNQRGQERILELTMEELNSLTKFRQHLESIGNFQWLASERELQKLKTYLYDNTETARKVSQLGWHPTGFYAFGNGIWKDGAFHKADDFGIVSLEKQGNWYIPAASKLYAGDKTRFERQRKFAHNAYSQVRFADYICDFVNVFGDNGKVGLCYFFASLFRDIITSHTRSFPILDLFGPKGSGKTELGTALMAFFVADNKAPNLKNSTNVALNDDVAFASNALVHFDEYKNDVHPFKIEFLKGLYDGVGRTKMGGSDFDERKMTSVKSGVIISGQEIPTADIALFHRCIYLSFPRSEYTMEERQRFAALRDVQKNGLTSLTLQVLELRKGVEARFLEEYDAVLHEIETATNHAPLETRIVENWAKMLAIYRCVSDRLQLPFGYKDIFKICKDGLVTQNNMSGEGNEVAKFWETIMYLRANGDIYEEGDFLIKDFKKFKSDIIAEKIYPEAHPVLLLNTSRIFTLYKENARRTGDKIIPEDALREYMKNADYYLGKVKSVRFKSIVKGIVEMRGSVSVSRVLQALAFDYNLLKERFSLNLDTTTSTDTVQEGDKETAQEADRRYGRKEEVCSSV